MKDIVSSLRMLGREGFNLVDAKTYATLASLHNHGVFGAGGLLIGSHRTSAGAGTFRCAQTYRVPTADWP